MCNRLYIVWCLLACFVCFGTGTVLGQSAVASLDPSKALTQYVHESWQVDEGLPQNSVNAIAQAEEGYLWLGTQEGLVRFDGLVFTVFSSLNVDAFRTSDVRVLHCWSGRCPLDRSARCGAGTPSRRSVYSVYYRRRTLQQSCHGPSRRPAGLSVGGDCRRRDEPACRRAGRAGFAAHRCFWWEYQRPI